MNNVLLIALFAACSPEEAPAPVVPPSVEPTPAEPPPPRLVINEVQVHNETTAMGPDGLPVAWVELLHLGPLPVDLATVTLSDGGAVWSGVGTLAVGERLLLWADGSGRPGALPFVVAAGETLSLSVGGVAVDAVRLDDQPDDTVQARLPDGAAWAATARPTPGAPNGTKPTDSLDLSELLFQDDRLLSMDLYLSSASEDALRYDPRTETPGAFGFDRWYFPDVGVRLKGGWGSTRSYDQKSGFKIDLNDADGAELFGLQKLTLNAMVQDASYVHESLAYDLFRAAGVPAPRTAWTELFVNGELYGLMLVVETVDDQFLKRWFADASGPMYEGAYGVDFSSGGSGGFQHDEGDDVGRDEIEAIASVLNGPATDDAIAELETLFDLENLLTVMAIEALTLHWDGYTTSNNYRIYLNPTDNRYVMIPWGTDQTFIDYWYGPWDANGRMFRFCMENIPCVRRYDDRLVEMADLMESLNLVVPARARRQLLGGAMQADPRREFDEWTHVDSFDRTIETLRSWAAQVRRDAIAHRP
jgi:hypothetical protein